MDTLLQKELGNEDVLLKVMFEHATVGIIMANEAGVIIRCNPYATKMFGYDVDELIDQQIEILIPRKFHAKHVEHRKSYLQNPVHRSMGANLQLFGKRKNGTQFPDEISLSYATLENEKLAIAYIKDFSKQKNLLEELQKNKNWLNEAQAVGHVGSFEWDVKKNKLIWSDELYRMFGFEPQSFEMTFDKIYETIHPDDLEITKKTIHKLKEDKTGVEYGYRIIRQDGEIRYIKVKRKFELDEDENVVRSFGLLSDITDKIKADQKLKEYSEQLEEKVIARTNELAENQVKLEKALKKEQELGELKSRFVSMASHEFRTPLSTVLSSSNLVELHLERESLDKIPKHLNKIKSSVGNLTSILNDFLSLEKLESGKVRFTPEPTDLNEFILNILEEVNLLAAKNQAINFVHTGKKEANIDEHLVRNILINLLSNAIKYSPNGEDVYLLLDRKATNLIIKVKDNGIGIPEEQHKEMFTRFFRANNVSTIQGTGIGLTIVKRYLDIMKGSIRFESKLNMGTTFIVEIPQ